MTEVRAQGPRRRARGAIGRVSSHAGEGRMRAIGFCLLSLMARESDPHLLRITIPEEAGTPSASLSPADLPEGFPSGWGLRSGERDLAFQFDPEGARLTLEAGALDPGDHVLVP